MYQQDCLNYIKKEEYNKIINKEILNEEINSNQKFHTCKKEVIITENTNNILTKKTLWNINNLRKNNINWNNNKIINLVYKFQEESYPTNKNFFYKYTIFKDLFWERKY